MGKMKQGWMHVLRLAPTVLLLSTGCGVAEPSDAATIDITDTVLFSACTHFDSDPHNARTACGLRIASVDGVHVLTKLEDGRLDLDPAWSPDGTSVAFATCYPTRRRCELRVLNIVSLHERVLVASDTEVSNDRPIWGSSGGDLVFRRCIIERIPRLREVCSVTVVNVASQAMRVLDTGSLELNTGVSGFALEPGGERVVFSAHVPDAQPGQVQVSRPLDLHVINLDGTGLDNLTGALLTADETSPSWAQDASRIVFVAQLDNTGSSPRTPALYTLNIDTHALTNATPKWSADALHTYDVAALSPDASLIAVAGSSDSGPRVEIVRADGSMHWPLDPAASSSYEATWSADGKRLAVHAGTHLDILANDGSCRVSVKHDGDDIGGAAAWSPVSADSAATWGCP